MMRSAIAFAAIAGGIALSPAVLAAPPAKASANAPMTKQQCLAAHEEALTLKTDKKPHAAHEKLVLCAKVECPNIVKKECIDQLDVVAAAAPTVVLEALDDKGNSDTAVKVTLDGSPATDKLTGSAIDLEPGEHVFVFERADGKKIEEKVLVVEGEKNRKVTADFQTLLPKKPDKPVEPPPPPAPPKKVPILAYVAGGIAVVGIGSFAAFSIMGRSKESDLAKGGATGCEPNCTADQLSPIKRDYIIGDVSLGIGIFALAAAVVLALPALTSSSPKAQAALGPAPWMPRVRVVQ